MRTLALILLLAASPAAAQTIWTPGQPLGNPASPTPPPIGAITPLPDRGTSDRLSNGIGNSQFQQQQLLRPQPGANWEEQRRLQIERDRLQAEQWRLETERRRLDPTRP